MRKFAAILLWGMLLFNLVGYRWLNSLMEDRANHHLQTQLDQQQYDKDQLITVKVAVTDLSYFTPSPTFERVSGEIEVDGIPYRYVERRIFNDSLEVRCIPNQRALQIRRLGSNYFQLVNDIAQGAKPDTHPHFAKSFSMDLFTCIQPLRMGDPDYVVIRRGFHFDACLPSVILPADEHPPAYASA